MSPGLTAFLPVWGLAGPLPLSPRALTPAVPHSPGALTAALGLSWGLASALALSAAAEEADRVVTRPRSGGPALGAALFSWEALAILSLLSFITCCSCCCHFLLADCRASRRSCSSDNSSSSSFPFRFTWGARGWTHTASVRNCWGAQGWTHTGSVRNCWGPFLLKCCTFD